MAERYHKRQAADKEHVRYCKERGPLRWWNFVTQRQLAGLHIDRANIVPYGMTIAEFQTHHLMHYKKGAKVLIIRTILTKNMYHDHNYLTNQISFDCERID